MSKEEVGEDAGKLCIQGKLGEGKHSFSVESVREDVRSMNHIKLKRKGDEINLGKDIAIFIDLDNVYYGLKKYHMDPDHPEPDHNLFLRLQQYYGKDSIRMMEAYADFELLDISMMSLNKHQMQRSRLQ